MRVLFEGKSGVLEGTADNGIIVRATGSPSLARTIQWVNLLEEHDGVAHGEITSEPAGQLRLV
jgi:hypothetical protein